MKSLTKLVLLSLVLPLITNCGKNDFKSANTSIDATSKISTERNLASINGPDSSQIDPNSQTISVQCQLATIDKSDGSGNGVHQEFNEIIEIPLDQNQFEHVITTPGSFAGLKDLTFKLHANHAKDSRYLITLLAYSNINPLINVLASGDVKSQIVLQMNYDKVNFTVLCAQVPKK